MSEQTVTVSERWEEVQPDGSVWTVGQTRDELLEQMHAGRKALRDMFDYSLAQGVDPAAMSSWSGVPAYGPTIRRVVTTHTVTEDITDELNPLHGDPLPGGET